MADCQRSVSSVEFSEWIAFWTYEHELQAGEEAEPDRDQLSAKIHGWAQRHNAAYAAQQARTPQLERVK